MLNFIFNHNIKTALAAVFLITVFSLPSYSKSSSTMNIPDFAYPQTVQADSRLQLEKALRDGDAAKTLRAFINLTVASSEISNENVFSLLSELDSINLSLPTPYNAIGYILEADIYCQIYDSDRWVYNSRTVPKETMAQNPEFWDQNLFAEKIASLIRLALSEKKEASASPLKKFATLVTGNVSYSSFTLYDFIVYKSIDLHEKVYPRNIIPFFSNPEQTIDVIKLVESLIDLHPSPSPARTDALIRKTELLPENEKKVFLWDCIKSAEATAETVDLLTYFYTGLGVTDTPYSNDSIPGRKEFFAFTSNLKKGLKTSASKNALDRLLAAMSAQSVQLVFPNMVRTGQFFEVEAESNNISLFYIILLKLKNSDSGRFTVQELESKTTNIGYKKVNTGDAIPFTQRDTLNFMIDSPGTYSFIVSRSPNVKDIICTGHYIYPSYFTVSDIDIITLNDFLENDNHGVFVVNSADGSPVENASVRFEEMGGYRTRQNRKTEKVSSGKDGYVRCKFDFADVYAEFNGSKAHTSLNGYRQHKSEEKVHTRIFTDRAVYRPGDTVNFFGLVFATESNHAVLNSDFTTEIELLNANREKIDTLTLTSDNSGRIFGIFIIPDDGLLGSWMLHSKAGDVSFEVAEYKTPTIFVTLEKAESPGDSLKFKGKAATYSGIPLPNTKVNFSVDYHPGWFFLNEYRQEASYSSNVLTDDLGEFNITLPLNNIDRKLYRGTFSIKAEITDNSGESVSSPILPFWLSDAWRISPSIPNIICVSNDTIPFHVPVLDVAGLPAIKTVDYVIRDEKKKIVEEGTFESPSLNTKALPSGMYSISFSLKDEENAIPQETNFVVYSHSDAVPPLSTPLWVPEKEYVIKKGQKKVSVGYGSSFAGQHILCVVSNSEGGVEFFWTVSDGANTFLDVDTPVPNVRKFITFVAYRNHEFNTATVAIVPEEQKEKLEIRTETFRNLLEPGQEEEWKFTLLYGGKPVEGYAYALLYDQALEAICPLDWRFNLYSPTFPNVTSLSGQSSWNSSNGFYGPTSRIDYYSLPYFQIQTYGYPLFGYRLRSFMFSRSTGANMKAMKAEYCDEEGAMDCAVSSVAEFSIPEEEVPGSEDVNSEHEQSAEKDDEFRPIELPVAFFRPDLCSNSDGILSIKFKVPNFNTTWKFLLGAYTPELASAGIRLETVASKKVMVKMHAPRFIRTGDYAELTASVYNNSETDEEIHAEFEIFNPLTGEVLERVKTEKSSVEPSGHNLISIGYDCPYDLNCVGLRIFAKSDEASDGEQTVIPVLPSSQPVIESLPFYLAPGQDSFSFKVPEYKADASVTFKYNDNPIWEVVTALPPITSPESESFTTLISALYANCVGKGIIGKHENIREGLRLITEGKAGDGLLKSNLEKDPELKSVTLYNTPWVNNARSESLRLSMLGSLLDSVAASENINKIWASVSGLRNADGGWSWCKGMKSSPWMTEAFLVNIGLLKGAGYLPCLPDLEDYVRGAINFVEVSYYKDYLLVNGKKDGFYLSILPYLYARSFFKDSDLSPSFDKIQKSALDYLEKSWENLSIFAKATAAITLWRDNRRMSAREILESLRQFASRSPERGAWFDNLDSDWKGAGKLLTTARVLMAFNEIQPSDSLVDKLRQWMLIQKQAQDWQEGLWSIDAIDAILNSGSEWTGNHAAPIVSIGNKKINPSEISKLTGEITLNVDVTDLKSRNIKISRKSPGPAWGGIISQYVAPMTEVISDAIADLSVAKEFWIITESEEGVSAVRSDNFNLGDKVRVSVIIDCGRDMDFVALTDERPACLEPVDQLSGNTVKDGLWCYAETRNNSTNLFFDFLPKGRHVVTYECRVAEEGVFASGIATVQCLYSPLLTAHSGGSCIRSH